jgi:hypothetical protein
VVALSARVSLTGPGLHWGDIVPNIRNGDIVFCYNILKLKLSLLPSYLPMTKLCQPFFPLVCV